MSDQPSILEDPIDAVFRPFIAFFGGMFLGYGAQLAQLSHWTVAAAFMLICVLIISLAFFLDGLFNRGVDAVFNKIGWGSGIKLVHHPVKRRKHWFVRFEWVPFFVFGVMAVYVLPEQVLEWL